MKNILYKIVNKIACILKPDAAVKNDIILINDEYINWLSFANAGMLQRGNLYCFDYAVKNIPSDNPILEIGAFCGLSTNIISYYKHMHKKNNKTYVIDKWIFEDNGSKEYIGFSEVKHADYKNFVKESFLRNVYFFSGNDLPVTFELFSDDFFSKWYDNNLTEDISGNKIQPGGKFSFVFIDGNHSYDYAKRDFINADKFLDINGFILFDDSFDNSIFEVNRLTKEILLDKRYKLICKNPNYFFQKIE